MHFRWSSLGFKGPNVSQENILHTIQKLLWDCTVAPQKMTHGLVLHALDSDLLFSMLQKAMWIYLSEQYFPSPALVFLCVLESYFPVLHWDKNRHSVMLMVSQVWPIWETISHELCIPRWGSAHTHMLNFAAAHLFIWIIWHSPLIPPHSRAIFSQRVIFYTAHHSQ